MKISSDLQESNYKLENLKSNMKFVLIAIIFLSKLRFYLINNFIEMVLQYQTMLF